MLTDVLQATEFTWVFVGIASILYFYFWRKRPINFPPGPRGFPLFGVIPLMGKYPERQIKKWSKQYGAVMSVRFASKDMVVLNDFRSIYQAFVKQHSKFSGRPHLPFFEQMNEGHGLIFRDYTDTWKRQRKFGLITLRGFGVGKKSMENKTLEEASCMNETIRNENGKPFDISTLLHNAVANNICCIVLGKRFQYDDQRFKEIMHRIMRSSDDAVFNILSSILMLAPFLMKIPPFSFFNRFIMNDVKFVLKLLREIVQEHEETFDDGDIRDFIDAFIVEMKKNEDPTFSQRQLLHYVQDLFVAGTETTSNSLYWSLLCLINYPDIQEKLFKEVVKVVGRNGTVSVSKKEDMPYTEAFIEEIYRFRTLVPLGLPHKTNEDVELAGYQIPKGTSVSANLWAIHNDDNVWTEPEKFNPERFLDEKGNFVRSNNVIAFSLGPRHCLGEQLARMEVFIFLVSMIQKFEFLPDSSASKVSDVNSGSNGALFVPLPYKLIAKER